MDVTLVDLNPILGCEGHEGGLLGLFVRALGNRLYTREPAYRVEKRSALQHNLRAGNKVHPRSRIPYFGFFNIDVRNERFDAVLNVNF